MKKSPKVANAALPMGKLFAATLMLVIPMHHAVAKDKGSVGLRGAYNLPAKDLADARLNNGFGIEGTMAYHFLPNLSIDTGWGWNKFAADQSFAGSNMEFEEAGYMLGLQLIQPTVRYRALAREIEIKNTTTEVVLNYVSVGFGIHLGFLRAKPDK